MIGALPLVAGAAVLFKRLRLAVALAVATVLKVSLEDVAKMFMQRDQPAQTLPDVILRGNSAAHGLSLSLRPRHGDLRDHRSGGPLLQRLVEGLALGPGRRGLPVRVYLGAHFPLDVAAGAGLGTFIGGALNLVFGVPGNSPSTARASGSP